jgi:hypothetical protein
MSLTWGTEWLEGLDKKHESGTEQSFCPMAHACLQILAIGHGQSKIFAGRQHE